MTVVIVIIINMIISVSQGHLFFSKVMVIIQWEEKHTVRASLQGKA